jgi:putative addiction module killer protein
VIYKLQLKPLSRFAITSTALEKTFLTIGCRNWPTPAKVASRVNRLASGNFGDCKPLRQGMCELRIDWGPGYRVYYAMLGRVCVLLLCGGDKRKQSADIDRALEYLKDYKERSETS